MLREALEEALAKGEKLKDEITKEILNSQFFNDLANNPRFVNAVSRVIRSQSEVARSLQSHVFGILDKMKIPTREQLKEFEHRVTRIEKELDKIGRNIMRSAMDKLGIKLNGLATHPSRTAKPVQIVRGSSKPRLKSKAGKASARPKKAAKKDALPSKRPTKSPRKRTAKA